MKKTIIGCLVLSISLVLLSIRVHSMWESHVEDTALEAVKKGNSQLKQDDTASLQAAVASYRKSITIFEGMHNALETKNTGIAYFNLGKTYSRLKQFPEAIDACRHAVDLLGKVDAKEHAADSYNILGLSYFKTEQLDKAADCYEKAEPLYRAAGKADKADSMLRVQAAMLYDKAVEQARLKNYTAARDTCMDSVKRYHASHDDSDEADAVHELALIYMGLRDSRSAADAYKQERDLRATIKTPAKG